MTATKPLSPAAASVRFRPTVTTCVPRRNDGLVQHLRRRIAGGAEQEAAVQRDAADLPGVVRSGWRSMASSMGGSASAADDGLEQQHRVAGLKHAGRALGAGDEHAVDGGGRRRSAHGRARPPARPACRLRGSGRGCAVELHGDRWPLAFMPASPAPRRGASPQRRKASSTSAGASSQPWRNRPLMRTRPGSMSMRGSWSGRAGRRLASRRTMRASASAGSTLCAATHQLDRAAQRHRRAVLALDLAGADQMTSPGRGTR